MDTNIGYKIAEVKEIYSDKSGLTFYHGRYKFVQMPFDLEIDTKAVLWAMHVILLPAGWDLGLLCLDVTIVL